MVLDGNHKCSTSRWKLKIGVLRRKLRSVTDHRNSLAGSERANENLLLSAMTLNLDLRLPHENRKWLKVIALRRKLCSVTEYSLLLH